MKFLIIEDEPLIASRLKRMVETITSGHAKIKVLHTLEEANDYIQNNAIDLCFLDLNLGGLNGFDLIDKNQTSSPTFQTIITSAYGNKALTAFEYKVLDFVPKPYKYDRVKSAIDRFFEINRPDPISLIVHCGNSKKIVHLEQIAFIKAAGNYSQVECINGKQYLHSDPIGTLAHDLNKDFIRVHKSYLVPKNQIVSLQNFGAGKYRVVLANDRSLPVSRSVYPTIQDQINAL